MLVDKKLVIGVLVLGASFATGVVAFLSGWSMGNTTLMGASLGYTLFGAMLAIIASK